MTRSTRLLLQIGLSPMGRKYNLSHLNCHFVYVFEYVKWGVDVFVSWTYFLSSYVNVTPQELENIFLFFRLPVNASQKKKLKHNNGLKQLLVNVFQRQRLKMLYAMASFCANWWTNSRRESLRKLTYLAVTTKWWTTSVSKLVPLKFEKSETFFSLSLFYMIG